MPLSPSTTDTCQKPCAFLMKWVKSFARSHPDAIGARCGHLDLGHRVSYRGTQSVREQIRRTHHVHRLLVNGPPATIKEALRFEEDRLRGMLGAKN